MSAIHKQALSDQSQSAVSSLEVFLKNKPWAARMVLLRLKRLAKGRLTLILPDQDQIELVGEECLEQGAVLEIKKWRAFHRILWRGEVGFAEAYVKGEWDTPDLVGLIKMLINNQEKLQRNQEPLFLLNWLFKIQNWFLANTPKQSIRNIRAHYDLGNNFYQLWLDPSMTYSCGLFEGKKRNLEEAQQAKYNRILDRLDLKEGKKILDIGCGWGGFAEAASNRGCEVEGITLSDEQLLYTKERAKKFPVKANFEKKDYRELTGQYEYITSIGMFEHIGRNYWNQYFQKIYELLSPGGKAMIQSIVYTGNDYYHYKHSISFVRLYIFPGGFLPTPDCIEKRATQVGLKVINKFDFGLDYAKTLSHWRENFLKALPEIYKLGFDEKFKRLWLYYLCASEAAFLTRETSVMQIEFIK